MRFGPRNEVAAQAFIGRWDLRLIGAGFDTLSWIFVDLFEAIGAGIDAPASRARTMARIRGQRFLRALGREAPARCDRRARELALSFAESVRFWVFQQFVADPSGRIAQMARVCPGLLVVAAAMQPTWRSGRESCRALLEGIQSGVALPRLLDAAAESSLAPHVVESWATTGGARRFACATPSERAKALAARRILIRRAGPRVSEADLMQMPPAAFAPEDIPREPIANARWYRTMRCANYVIEEVPDVATREGLSAFVSANGWLVAARARRGAPPPTDPADVHGGGLRRMLQSLIRFGRQTGRVPSRRSNALRMLDACERRRREEGSPAGRLGELLRRILPWASAR